MARKLTGIDVAMLVGGVIVLILTFSLFGVTATIAGRNTFTGVMSTVQFIVGGWYLLIAALAIAAGVTGHRAPYIAVIVLTILGVFVALGGGVMAVLAVFTGVFEAAASSRSGTITINGHTINTNNNNIPFGGSYDVTTRRFEVDFRGYSRTTTVDPELRDAVSDAVELLGGLPYGLIVIHSISFIILIVVSSFACCGTCCNQARIPPHQGATVVTTSGGYVAAPPGYVGQPPDQQQYAFQGMSNPNYDNSIALNSYKS